MSICKGIDTLHRSSFRGISAFTLIEMMLVISIMGLMSALAIPSLVSRLPDMHLNNTIWQLNALMRSARTQAMAESCRVELSLNATNSTYEIWADRNHDNLKTDNELLSRTVDGLNKVEYSYWPQNTVAFHADGTFVSGDDYYNVMWFWLRAGNAKNSYTVMVWPSGQMSTYKYNNG